MLAQAVLRDGPETDCPRKFDYPLTGLPHLEIPRIPYWSESDYTGEFTVANSQISSSFIGVGTPVVLSAFSSPLQCG